MLPYYKTEDPDPRNCSTGRVRSTTLLRPLFYDFSLSCNDRNRGGGYRCKICTVPTPFLCLPDPLDLILLSERASGIHTHGPEFESLIFSSGSCRHNTVWEPYRSCTDTLTLDHNRDEKEKNRKKVDGVV